MQNFSPLLFASLLFTAICKASPDSHFAFLHFISMRMVLIPVSCTMSRTSAYCSSGTQSIRSSPSMLKSKDITLPTKVRLVKAMVFPVVIYGCESWTVKKAERQRIDAFELWCWRRLLRVPWTARRSSQSILKEISPGISLEGMMLKLKL